MNGPSTNATKENAGLGPGVLSANEHKHDQESTADRQNNKALSNWQSLYALQGHCLYQVKATDGNTSYLATRWGMTREMESLDEVAKFFALIGGKL